MSIMNKQIPTGGENLIGTPDVTKTGVSPVYETLNKRISTTPEHSIGKPQRKKIMKNKKKPTLAPVILTADKKLGKGINTIKTPGQK